MYSRSQKAPLLAVTLTYCIVGNVLDGSARPGWLGRVLRIAPSKRIEKGIGYEMSAES